MRRVVVVGASLAGLNTVEGLRDGGFDGDITLVGAEAHRPYQRPPLSKQLLAGTWGRDRIDLRVGEDLGVEFLLGVEATGVDPGGRHVHLADGSALPFDGLVVATGAAPRRLPSLGSTPGVHYLRTVDDCLALREAFAARPRVVIIGAGFIGGEVAATARGLGLEVTLLEALPVPLGRALGERMGMLSAEVHRDHGVDLRLGAMVQGVEGDGRVEAVLLQSGEVVPADLVVVGIGVEPVTGWLEGSGLTLADGVVCDPTCAAVGVEGVWAAGDVARWEHPLFDDVVRFEHWDNAVAQGRAVAANMLAGDGGRPFDHVPFFWSDQYDVKLQFVGHARPDDDVTVVEGSLEDRRFVAVYGRAGRVVGALLVNRPPRLPTYQRMVAERAPVPTGPTG